MYPHYSTCIFILIYSLNRIIFTESYNRGFKNHSVSAILACGGSGTRFIESGGKGLKQFNTVNDVPIYLFSLYELIKHPRINHIVIATHSNLFNEIINNINNELNILNGENTNNNKQDKNVEIDNNYIYICNNRIILKSDYDWEYFENRFKCQKSPPFDLVKISFCESGKSRKYTVINALRLLNQDSDLVLIHDSARPLIYAIDLDMLISVASQNGAAVPFIKVNDTVKEQLEIGLAGDKIINRDSLIMVQTPQAFKSNLIKEAYENADKNMVEYSDCSTYFQKYLCRDIHLIPGHVYNIKITTLEDYNIAKNLLIEKYFKSKG